MTLLIVKAPDISCAHCLHTIQTEVSEMTGVKNVQAELDSKLVTIAYDSPATQAQIEALMAEIGYPPQAV
jgi:copper chaperone CopZ